MLKTSANYAGAIAAEVIAPNLSTANAGTANATIAANTITANTLAAKCVATHPANGVAKHSAVATLSAVPTPEQDDRARLSADAMAAFLGGWVSRPRRLRLV